MMTLKLLSVLTFRLLALASFSWNPLLLSLIRFLCTGWLGT
jgi:hypothetical protein